MKNHVFSLVVFHGAQSPTLSKNDEIEKKYAK